MKKFFTLMAVVMVAASASAVTPFKNLYVQANANPTGAGTVYLDPKSADDGQYMVDCSESMGETAFIKLVFGENGGGGDYTVGCNKGLGVYEVKVDALPESGYELVCLADKVVESGVYGPDDCYPSIDGTGENNRTFNFVWTGEDIININVPNDVHDVDGNSNGEINGDRNALMSQTDLFHETPDVQVYAIFREVGAELPKFDPEKTTDETGVKSVAAEKVANTYFTVTGQQLSSPVKGINIVNGKKVVVK